MPVVQRLNRRLNQRKHWWRGIGLGLPLALVLALAACGVSTTGMQPGGGTNGTPTATSGGTPMSSVPPTNAIGLSSDKSSYMPSSTINVTLINRRSTSVFAFDHQTACTILTLQRQTTGGWQSVGGCALGRATQLVEIKAGATMQIALAPGAGQLKPSPWPAGTYRVVFAYALDAQNMSAGLTVATPDFAIG